MIFSYNWLKDHIKKLPKPKKLAKLLTMRSFEVKEVKKVLSDFALDIDILPNRGPDCFSHIGIAREVAVITNGKLRIPSFKLQENKKIKAKDFVTIDVKDKISCPRYTARVITDVKVAPSPKWIQKRLKVCGLRPINNIVDIANYVMLETGQPLHAFDLDKISGKKIIIRKAKKVEKIVTLDNEKYDLGRDILIISDTKGPLAIAGIKGGKKAEIGKRTKTVVLESANFNSRIIRRGSKKLGLKTDASWRFEHRIDPNLTEIAINQTAGLIQEIAKGKVNQGLVDFYPKKVGQKRIKLDLDYVEDLLGIKISKTEIKNLLKRLEFQLSEVQPRKIEVEVPTFRLDVSLPEDVIEEIGRIVGFEKIPSAFPIATLIPPKRNVNIFWEDTTKNILKTADFSEVYNYSFVSEKDAKTLRFRFNELIGVENPISPEQKYLRPSLIPGLLKNVKENQKFLQDIRIFELGKIFKISNPKSKTKIYGEKRTLSGIMTGDAFLHVKGAIELLLNQLGISNIWYDSYQATPEDSEGLIWHPKICAEIKVDHEEIGFLGEIKPDILGDLKIKGRVVVFDFDFEKLQNLSSEETIYQPVSPYPAALRDLAVLVPQYVKVVDVLNEINRAGGELIRDVDLFDIYEGPQIPSDTKNLAFHIIYQSERKTLKAKEIDKVHQKIIRALENNPEWQVRK